MKAIIILITSFIFFTITQPQQLGVPIDFRYQYEYKLNYSFNKSFDKYEYYLYFEYFESIYFVLNAKLVIEFKANPRELIKIDNIISDQSNIAIIFFDFYSKAPEKQGLFMIFAKPIDIFDPSPFLFLNPNTLLNINYDSETNFPLNIHVSSVKDNKIQILVKTNDQSKPVVLKYTSSEDGKESSYESNSIGLAGDDNFWAKGYTFIQVIPKLKGTSIQVYLKLYLNSVGEGQIFTSLQGIKLTSYYYIQVSQFKNPGLFALEPHNKAVDIKICPNNDFTIDEINKCVFKSIDNFILIEKEKFTYYLIKIISDTSYIQFYYKSVQLNLNKEDQLIELDNEKNYCFSFKDSLFINDIEYNIIANAPMYTGVGKDLLNKKYGYFLFNLNMSNKNKQYILTLLPEYDLHLVLRSIPAPKESFYLIPSFDKKYNNSSFIFTYSFTKHKPIIYIFHELGEDENNNTYTFNSDSDFKSSFISSSNMIDLVRTGIDNNAFKYFNKKISNSLEKPYLVIKIESIDAISRSTVVNLKFDYDFK